MNMLKRFVIAVLLLLSRLHDKKRIPVLLYHRILKDNLDDRISFSTYEQFTAQLNYLVSHEYRTIKTDELVRKLSGQEPIIGNEIVITFDDGFDDNYDAIKLANYLGLSTTVFIATAYIGETYEYIPYKGNIDLGYVENKCLKPAPIKFLSKKRKEELSEAGNEFFAHTLDHVA